MWTQGTLPDHWAKSIYRIGIFWVGIRLGTSMIHRGSLLVAVSTQKLRSDGFGGPSPELGRRLIYTQWDAGGVYLAFSFWKTWQ